MDDYDLTTPDGLAKFMSEATSEADWNRKCNEVKGANGGDYPSFWFRTIIMSGLMDRTLGKGTSTIKISPIEF